MNKQKQLSWQRYRNAIDVLPMGSKEWSDALVAGPAGFMDSEAPIKWWEISPEIHEMMWRSYWGIPKEIK